MILKLPLTCALLASAAIVHAQEAPPTPAPPSAAASSHSPPAAPARETGDKAAGSKWNVEAPTGLTLRKVPLNTDEGTWMNVDVSPDGKRMALAMQGGDRRG